MTLDESDGDAASIARLQAMDAVNPLFKVARARRKAYEQRLEEILDARWPAQHPFEYDPKKPSLHP
jgi:hypothetical protein